MQRTYSAFISYRHQSLDSAVAKRLHGMIERYRVPKALRESRGKRLGIVFRDQDELTAGDLSQEIRTALENSEYLIVVCSPGARESVWVDREIRCFLSSHSRERILPVLVSGEPAQAFPEALVSDLASGESYDPLAADVRGGSHREVMRKLRRESRRIFAAMLGCSFDDLILREQRRRLARFAAAAGAVVAVSTLFAGTLLIKNRQIASANQELDQQKNQLLQANAQILLRESMLLTVDARKALDAGDIRGAIASAVQALPRLGSEDRPFYTPAESVLMEAMNVFSPDTRDYLLGSVTLEQLTPVKDFSFTQDGRRLVTIDAYGTTACYDTSSGTLLWRSSTQPQSGLYLNFALYLCGGDTVAVHRRDAYMEGYSMETGELLWTFCASGAFDGGCYYNRASDTLVLLGRDPINFSTVCLFRLCPKTGETLQSILFPQEGSLSAGLQADLAAGAPPQAISDDGRWFAAVSRQQLSDDTQELICVLADLQEGTARIAYRQCLSGYKLLFLRSMALARDGGSLTMLLTDYDSPLILQADLSSGETRWQTTPPEDSRESFLTWAQVFLLPLADRFAVGIRDRLYYLDQSGSILDSRQLPGDLTSLELVNNRWFSCSCEDGTCAIGFPRDNRMILSLDPFFAVSADVKPHTRLNLWGQGILQYYSQNDSIVMGVNNLAGSGFAAVIPKENPNAVSILRPVPLESASDWEAVSGSPLYDMISDFRAASPDGEHLVVGPFRSDSRDGTGNTGFQYVAIDRQNHCVAQIWDVDWDYNRDCLFFREQGQWGYILCSERGQVRLFRENSETTLCAEGEWGDICAGCSAYLSRGGVRTARMDAQTLTLWYNGRKEAEIPLPEDFLLGFGKNWETTSLLRVGGNGFVLAGHFPSVFQGVPTLAGLAVYSPEENQWIRLPGSDPVPNTDALSLGQTLPRLAYCAENGEITVCDLQTGETLHILSTGLPPAAISRMEFLLEDTALVIRTRDGQYLIYDLSTGSLVFQAFVRRSSYDMGNLCAYVDQANQRLYLLNGSSPSQGNGLCISLTDWSLLSDQVSGLWFDECSGALYGFSHGEPIRSAQIPGHEALITIAEILLSLASG